MTTPSRLWRTNEAGETEVDFNAGQRRYLESVAREILFSGFWGNGKSVALCFKLWILAELFPGSPLALLRKKYSDLRISTLRRLRGVFGEPMWREGVVGGERPSAFNFRNGSFIDFIGLKDNPGKLLSTEYVAIAADECNELEENDWEMAAGRLRAWAAGGIGQLFGACNPDHPGHWLFHRFNPNAGTHVDRGEIPCARCSESGLIESAWADDEAGTEGTETITCPSCQGAKLVRFPLREVIVAGKGENDENLPPHAVHARRALTGVRKQRYDEGKWVAYEGLVFPMFENPIGTHIVNAPASWARWNGYPPPDWPRYRGIDFGFYPSVFTCIWVAFDPQERAWVYRQYGWTRRPPSEHSRMINGFEAVELDALRKAARGEKWLDFQIAERLAFLPLMGSYADHDDADAAELQKHGVSSTPAKKGPGSVGARHEHLMDYMMDVPGYGPRFFIVREPGRVEDPTLHEEKRPASLEAELATLLWSRDASGSIIREEPQKENGHFVDAVSYCLYTKDKVRLFVA